LCAQEKLVAILEKRWGKPIGYKAALTNETVQRNFGVREPVRGVLLADMMLEDGAKLPAKFGALPRYEADPLVIVANAEINKAKSTKEVLAHLASVHPFIELPVLIVDAPPHRLHQCRRPLWHRGRGHTGGADRRLSAKPKLERPRS
jgi:2-oxo-hept-3-ene-1,7-dioate hydratase